jgi:hypothetical protein
MLGYPGHSRRITVALIDKREFVGLDGVAHLCTGGEAPWLVSHTEA